MLAWFIALWVGWDCFCLGDWDLLFACSLPILLFYSVYWGFMGWGGGVVYDEINIAVNTCKGLVLSKKRLLALNLSFFIQ